MSHYTSCSYDTTLTDGYSWTDGYVAANPSVCAYFYRKRFLNRLASLLIIKRMLRCIEMTIWSYQTVVTNLYRGIVKECAG